MTKERKLDLSNFYPEFLEATKKSNPEKYAANPLFAEMNAQTEARKLALEIGNEEWRKGNTKYAFEAYEAASVPPSEILEKAKALLESEILVRSWRENQNLKDKNSNTNCRYYNINIHSFQYCSQDDCAPCASYKVLNRTCANQIYKLLNWTPPEKEIESSRIEHDLYSKLVLIHREADYRPAAVAALKLVKRLNIVYITENQEEN